MRNVIFRSQQQRFRTFENKFQLFVIVFYDLNDLYDGKKTNNNLIKV